MWQTKYASAVTKNLGVGVDFRPFSEGYFFSGRPQSVFPTKLSESEPIKCRKKHEDWTQPISLMIERCIIYSVKKSKAPWNASLEKIKCNYQFGISLCVCLSLCHAKNVLAVFWPTPCGLISSLQNILGIFRSSCSS